MEMLIPMAEESGIETPTAEDLIRPGSGWEGQNSVHCGLGERDRCRGKINQMKGGTTQHEEHIINGLLNGPTRAKRRGKWIADLSWFGQVGGFE